MSTPKVIPGVFCSLKSRRPVYETRRSAPTIRNFPAQSISQENSDGAETTRAVRDAKSRNSQFNMQSWRLGGPLRLSDGMRPYAIKVIAMRP